ncbi:RBBP8 N-terminal-like protein [Cyclopterus lumpus]|uniref:Retinoblastoma binding protein 8-like n=1 Tax=Cyclopterus lumpus TaxID=8103 RepID=A0A8C2WE79_CYCLU|nr:RBBP8 N-terminal-like protein [Cyclopterus lumpus]XP_034392167.1 RBBP8 N-terminal-like protein [Cyclopterus lumpus]
MECFNSMLLKLREIHEREVEGWQGKIQELANKKGCDTKRMEDLFSKNQQMKEQQRVLTENIKTLENRLRAGLCDRCTVTQEVAKRRQQEFESSQIQSIQHITLLAGEMNNLKKENKQLREELQSIRAALDKCSSSSSSTTEVKPNSSPGLSPSSGPVVLVSEATSRASNQPADGNVAANNETDQRAEESEQRRLRGMNRSYFESYKPLSWRTEHGIARLGERRAQSVEGLDQRCTKPPQALLLKTSSSSTGGEVNPSRHVLHAPVPCRPQPIKRSPVSFPWPISESSDWVTAGAPGTSLVQSSPKSNLPRFPNLIPTSQHASPLRQAFGSPWHKPSALQPHAKEPTVVFRLRSLQEHVETQTKPQEKKEILPTKTERVSAEGLREVYDAPLDLSDRAKSKSSQWARDDSPSSLHGGERVHMSPDIDGKAHLSSPEAVSSPPSCSWTSCPPVKLEQEESTSDDNHKIIKEQEQKEEGNGKTDQSNGKKVPVLTISLRPVVVLENLNSALQESLSSNGKTPSPATEPVSSSDEHGEEGSVSGPESNHGGKRKRASVETETDRDSETDHIQRERKMKITVRTEEKSTC